MDTEQKPINSGFGAQSTAEEVAAGADLRGKLVVITGGYAGIGLETARVLAKAGASIVAGARDMKKAEAALSSIGNLEVLPLDLAEPESIDRFAARVHGDHNAIHLLINNAGIMAAPLMRDRRGYEMQFATNHLGHFQLTARLWDALKRAGGSRVVTLSSFGHRYSDVHLEDPNFNHRPYDRWKGYGQSKTANVLFAVELDRRGRGDGIRGFALHPGRIPGTDLARYLSEEDLKGFGISREKGVFKGPNIKTIEQGAATTVWCAVSPQLEGKGGVYCADCDIAAPVPDDSQNSAGVLRWAIDKTTARALWDLSEKLIA
jgi:NAD(P)-dependent dehydrogenase (short-subunit alcohol dehydrogenase family)